MAQWQSKLDLCDIWGAVDEGKMTIQELSREVSIRLRKLKPTSDEGILDERDDIADQFESLYDYKDATFTDFNYIMNDLYDWADIPLPPLPHSPSQHKKVCWVATKF
jgi:hypothetical protein